MRPGVTPHYPVHVHEVERDENGHPSALVAYGPTRRLKHRGDTLNLPLLTVRFSSPMENVVRVQLYHHKGAPPAKPQFELLAGVPLAVEVRNGAGELVTTLEVGNGYAAGDRIEVYEGVHVSFALGTLVTGEQKVLRDHVVTAWATFVTGNAGGRASVRDEEWNYVVRVHEEDPAPELYHLPSDPDERHNVHDQHPEVVAHQRRRLEAVVGGPLPATLNEVCDPAPAPVVTFLRNRFGSQSHQACNVRESPVIHP